MSNPKSGHGAAQDQPITTDGQEGGEEESKDSGHRISGNHYNGATSSGENDSSPTLIVDPHLPKPPTSLWPLLSLTFTAPTVSILFNMIALLIISSNDSKQTESILSHPFFPDTTYAADELDDGVDAATLCKRRPQLQIMMGTLSLFCSLCTLTVVMCICPLRKEDAPFKSIPLATLIFSTIQLATFFCDLLFVFSGIEMKHAIETTSDDTTCTLSDHHKLRASMNALGSALLLTALITLYTAREVKAIKDYLPFLKGAEGTSSPQDTTNVYLRDQREHSTASSIGSGLAENQIIIDNPFDESEPFGP